MSTRIDDEREGAGTPSDAGSVPTSSDQPATPANGTTTTEHWHPGQSTPCHYVGGRIVTPATAKLLLQETPEEREERIRHTRAVLKSLLPKTPEEVEEQRETLRLLMAALNEERAPHCGLFADPDE